jgi:hypothetical protein
VHWLDLQGIQQDRANAADRPLLYGEGRRAFQRLQEELIKASDDCSIFVWDWLPRFERTGRSGKYFPQLRVDHLIDIGWDVQPPYTTEEVDFAQYQGAADITSGATSMFASDPVFFFASSVTYDLTHFSYDTPTPFFITNKGLSISLPIHDLTATRSPYIYGGPAPLATLCIHERAKHLTGYALFLAPSSRSKTAYRRAFGKDGEGRFAPMFRGHLLSFTLPLTAFWRYFRSQPNAILVPAAYGCQSLFAWDQTPEVALYLLRSDKEPNLIVEIVASWTDSSRINLFTMRPQTFHGLQTGAASSGAIYYVTLYADARGYYSSAAPIPDDTVVCRFFVLVRAVKRSHAGVTTDKNGEKREDPFRWRCELVKDISTLEEPNPPRSGLRWMMQDSESTPLTFPEILDLPIQETDGQGQFDCHELLVPTESGAGVFNVGLGGPSYWVTNPASSIRFLYVTEQKSDGVEK